MADLLEIDIRYHGTKPDGMMTREFNRALKEAFAEIAGEYQRDNVDKHFTNRGAREYGYTPRVGESGRPARRIFRGTYTGRKLREKQHSRPLTWSGESRRLAATGRVTSTSKGARITVPAPTLNFRNRRSPIVMAQEIKTISGAEGRHLARRLGEIMAVKLSTARETATVKIGRGAGADAVRGAVGVVDVF